MTRTERDLLRQRQGEGYARIGPRKRIARATGLSTTTVHRRCSGATAAIAFDELAQMARDGSLNPLAVLEEAEAVIRREWARLPAEELAVRLAPLIHEETREDGEEDVAEARLLEAVYAINMQGAAGLTLPQRRDIAERIRTYIDRAVRVGATMRAMVGLLEALEPQIAATERAH